MDNKFTAEMIEKAKAAKTPEELIALSKENGIELTAEQAKEYYEQLNKSGEISDNELDNVSGGGCGGGEAGDTPKYPIGTQVTYKRGSYTPTMTVVEARLNDIYNEWCYTLRINADGHLFNGRYESELKAI